MWFSIWLLFGLAWFVTLAGSTPILAKDIAVCGASEGYGYYPRKGLTSDDPDAGKWVEDGISNGRMTLITTANDALDLLVADSTGAVYSTINDGGTVIPIGRSNEMLSVIIVYELGGTVETYTFLNSVSGPEVIWSSNKFGTLILKIAAFRAPCSFIDLD